jgi:hypothetical protein
MANKVQMKKGFENLGRLISKLQTYISSHGNVHTGIKKISHDLDVCFKSLSNPTPQKEKTEGLPTEPERAKVDRATQYSCPPSSENRDCSKELRVTEDTVIVAEAGITVTVRQETLKKSTGRDHLDLSSEKQEARGAKQKEKKEKNRSANKNKELKPKPTTLELISPGSSYADILKRVKSIDTSELEVEVLSMRKSKTGNLEVRLRDPSKAFKSTIEEKAMEVKVVERTRHTVLHVKGLDCLTTAEELVEALAKAGDCASTEVTVTSLRPAYGETQKATVKMLVAPAGKIIRAGRVKIGWIYCKVDRRTETPRCFRCWETGHMANNCKGPSRKDNCMNCGKEGHKIKDCKESPSCLKCGKEGHRTISCSK